MEAYEAYGRRGSVAAVWCALAGVSMATALAAPLGVMQALVLPYAPSFATAFMILFVSAWTLGDLAGHTTPLDLHLDDDSLLAAMGAWHDHARFIGAHYTPGARNVWMGRPLRASRAVSFL